MSVYFYEKFTTLSFLFLEKPRALEECENGLSTRDMKLSAKQIRSRKSHANLVTILFDLLMAFVAFCKLHAVGF